MNRRTFLGSSAVAAARGAPPRPVRVGVVGTGNRGTGLLRLLLAMDGTEVPAVCDVNAVSAARAQGMVEKSGRARPEAYARGEEDFRRLVERSDLDAVIIATPWEWHAPMALAAMNAGKWPAVEVPAAITIQGCWQLVDASERTGVPCMMLENWSFRRDNLAVLNMIREGLLGEVVHCHCAHSHDVMYWYFDAQGNLRWSGRHLLRRNADQYPTHSLGPVLSWMDVNCGDVFTTLVSMATRSLGIRLELERRYGRDHPPARLPYRQGDIVTSLVKTAKGNTVVINNDMQLPRPYDNRWMIQGTLGLYDEARSAVYVHGRSPKPEQWGPFAPYQEKHDHRWWKALPQEAPNAGHGGPDYLELKLFAEAVRTRSAPPLDVYDSVTMSAVIPLSEQSIAQGSAPVAVPDFTRGKWKTRQPAFALPG